MKVSEHIKNANGKTLFSFEVLPPKKGENIKSLFNCIDPLMEFNPAFIDVTYSREDIEVKHLPDGTSKTFKTRKRPGTVGITAAIMHRYHIDVVPHLICGGFSKEETEYALIDLEFLGVDNILALQGDKMNAEPDFIAHPQGNAYASDLVQQIMDLNQGKYLDEDLGIDSATNFCIGVAGYPEKHYAAVTLEEDLKFLKLKQDLGAEYIVTQLFFDNAKFFDFLEKCRKVGITIPIIPGLKPLTTKTQLRVLPQIFFTEIPEDLQKAVLACADNEAVKQVGIEWAIQQSKELKEFGVPALHYYTMSRAIATKEIVKAVF